MGLKGKNEKIARLASGGKSIDKFALLNVSFKDALRFGPRLDEHFKSPSQLCDVCNVPYDIIGKMETFNDDVKFFLASLNKTRVFDSMGDVSSSTETSIVSEIVQRSFENLSEDMKDCNFCHALLKRIWDAFKIRGFISDFVNYPISGPDQCCATSMERFKSLALKAVEQSEDREIRSLQRNKYFLMAFRSVPLKYLKQFRDSVARDCELFDYDCSPPEIFAGRTDGDEEKNIFSD